MVVKEAYTSNTLAPMMGMTRQGIDWKAKVENWQSRPRSGRGGGKEWLASSMPESTRLAIQVAEEKAALAESDPATTLPALSATTQAAIMDDSRRNKALARADLVRQYLSWLRRFGYGKKQRQDFIAAYMGGAWPKLLEEVGKVSWQTLERWKVAQERAGSVLALTDKRGVAHRGRTLLTERHRTVILGHILNPNAPAISQCVNEVQKKFQAEGIYIPSEPTIRRFVKSYMQTCFDAWTLFREGKKAWNDKCAISLLRDWNLVSVGDIVIADGHTLNFESTNPATGKPKRMTILLFYDGASNCPLGWEIMPTENTASISAAFRRTCIMLGKFPRVVYIDNGRAFRARFFEGCPDFEQAGIFGLYESLGCKVIHAWPYHGQSKPIERFFGTMHGLEVWMPSYTGFDIAHKPARMKRGEELHRQLYEKMGGRPLTLEETHYQVARWFAEYAERPQFRTHLHGRKPGEVFMAGRGDGLSEADMNKLTELMMQKKISVITKDGIRLNGRLYWHEGISRRRHEVLVRYDEHLTPDHVLVYDMDGNFICKALDREHHHIASGLHPAADYLGTSEQQAAFKAALELKGRQKNQSEALMRGMLTATVMPEVRAHVAAIQNATPPEAPKRAKVIPLTTPTAEEKAAFEAAKAQARADMDAAPGYTPSDLKRWKDSQERYAYLFKVKFEQGAELVPADAAWMEAYEQTPEYERYGKARYEGLKAVYARQSARMA
ncbi:Mu transposase C-terminal domain-containing protein [Desulfovibrio sp. ZJ200]|uniref:Mu transposase C-terminal domain-containing protein n=1 Tax=Desulfovibrio sp. ZJ200 TaxID=2709792 RepID=UPI0013ED8B5A|nr:Mu transposase C-terminal domain-containing protein [Desulfovibrio sp. ZJ200]